MIQCGVPGRAYFLNELIFPVSRPERPPIKFYEEIDL